MKSSYLRIRCKRNISPTTRTENSFLGLEVLYTLCATSSPPLTESSLPPTVFASGPSSSNQSHHANDVLVQDLSNKDAFDVDEVDYSSLDDGFDSGSKFLSSLVMCSAKRQEDDSKMGGSSAIFSDRIMGDSSKAADVTPLSVVVAPTVVNATSPVPTIVGPPAPTASAPLETIILPNGSTLNKKVVYETMPRFCKLCQVLSHSTTACPSAGSKLAPQGSGETESRNRGSALQRLDPTGDQVVRNIETI
ncbi:hypothetical protein Peur_038091 [Populus x canadensis]